MIWPRLPNSFLGPFNYYYYCFIKKNHSSLIIKKQPWTGLGPSAQYSSSMSSLTLIVVYNSLCCIFSPSGKNYLHTTTVEIEHPEKEAETRAQHRDESREELLGCEDLQMQRVAVSRPSSSTSPEVADSTIPWEKVAYFTLAPTILLISRNPRLSESVLRNHPQQGLALCLSANPPGNGASINCIAFVPRSF